MPLEASVEMYDVKTRQKVSVPLGSVEKVTYPNGRHALRGTYEGRKLTQFCSKETYANTNCAVGTA